MGKIVEGGLLLDCSFISQPELLHLQTSLQVGQLLHGCWLKISRHVPPY